MLVNKAESAGWVTMVQYARGCMSHGKTGQPLAVRPSWAVRMRKGDNGAVAVYRGGAWDTIYGWSPTTFLRRIPSITALHGHLNGG
jgi:hypothetical protein